MTTQDQKPHIHVTAGLIRKNGKILITKRPKGSHLEGYWEFPGGKQERGEDLQTCLERELMEELGLKVRAAEEACLTIFHEYETKRISLHVMECTLLTDEPKALECQEFRWVDTVELNNFQFPPPDIKVIEFLSRASDHAQALSA
jgi:mutator protein MutT